MQGRFFSGYPQDRDIRIVQFVLHTGRGTMLGQHTSRNQSGNAGSRVYTVVAYPFYAIYCGKNQFPAAPLLQKFGADPVSPERGR